MRKIDFNASYVGFRPDVERLIAPDARAVLDVGCSTGLLGAAVKARTGAKVTGIELCEEMAEEARGRIDNVLVGDATEILAGEELKGHRFDTIICADILEHLLDPWKTLKAAVSLLSPQGVVVASIPNIRHLDTIYNLAIKGYWPYRDRGIHDRTHLRFFTRKNIVELFEYAGLRVEVMEANYRFVEKPHGINKMARYFALPGIRNLLAFQYLIRARLGTQAEQHEG